MAAVPQRGLADARARAGAPTMSPFATLRAIHHVPERTHAHASSQAVSLGTVRQIAACMIGLLVLGGCSSRVSVSQWQDELERYADQQADGDMSFLRDGPGGAAPRQFTVIGNDSPNDATDVVGVFLGRRNVMDRPWLVFLVGSVEKREVDDIRIALLADDAAQRRWIVSSGDDKTLRAYKIFRNQTWRAQHPSRRDPPLNALSF